MAKLVLYTRPDCHLCDDALYLVGIAAPGATVEAVDIEGDLELIGRYGLRVPVLARAGDAAELEWPFDADDVQAFLGIQ